MMRRHPLAKDIATIVLGAALLILPGLAAVDVFNPDEPREAEIAREMRASGDLVVPTFNGCPFLEKPPLFYWGVGLAAKLQFLREEAIVRLPSVLAAISLLLVTYFLGRELFDRRTGRAGALLLLTTFQFWWYARRGLLDMTLSAFVGAAILFFAMAVRRRAGGMPDHGRTRSAVSIDSGDSGAVRGARWSIGLLALAGAAAAGAALTKGLIGLVIPAVAAASWLLWRRELRAVISPSILAAAAVPVLALGAWIAALAIRPEGACFVREFLIENHVKRFFGGGYGGHEQPFWYYLQALLTDELPWVVFLPSAVAGLWPGLRRQIDEGSEARTEGKGGDGPKLLLAWLLPCLVFLSISSGKRSLYLLPLGPAIALLVAAWWRTRAPSWRRRAKGPAAGRGGLAVRLPASALLVLGLVLALALPVAIGALRTGIDVRRAEDALVAVRAAPAGVALGGVLLAAVLAIQGLDRGRRSSHQCRSRGGARPRVRPPEAINGPDGGRASAGLAGSGTARIM